MDFDNLFEQSNNLARDVLQVIDRPLFNDSQRIQVSEVLCSLSMEYGDSARALLQAGLVIHRAQFGAVVRAIWTLYAGTDCQLAKLDAGHRTGSKEPAQRHRDAGGAD